MKQANSFERSLGTKTCSMKLNIRKIALVTLLFLLLGCELQSRPHGAKVLKQEALLFSLDQDVHLLTERAQRKPRSEPETEPEGERTGSQNHAFTEPNSDPESKSNSTGKSEPTPENWPEPGPHWDDAYETWKWAWELHVYLYATIFLTIGLYAGYYVIVNVYDGLQGKYLSMSLNTMVAFFGLTRAFVMYLDPYHQGDIIHNTAVMRVIWSLSGPCLTASDCLVILALIETANISIAPPKLQKASVNAAIIFFHFALVITTDCVVADYAQAKAMLLFCQLFFATWGSVLGTANFILGYKLDKQLFSHKNPKETADKIYIYLIYASGAANYFLCGIIIYSAFGVFGVYSDVQFVAAWPWWALQTLSRFSEILACVLIFTVSAKRARVKDAVSMVTDDKTCESICPIEERSSSDSKIGRWAKCLKRKKKASGIDNGSQVSLCNALQEIAIAQLVTGGYCYGTNPIPQITVGRECWIETNTTYSIIHVPGATEFRSLGNKGDDMLNSKGEEELEREFVNVGFSRHRRDSMFSVLHDAKRNINIGKYSFGEKSLVNAGALGEREEAQTENNASNGNKSDKAKKVRTNKVSPEMNCLSFNAGVFEEGEETENKNHGNKSGQDFSDHSILTLPNEAMLNHDYHA